MAELITDHVYRREPSNSIARARRTGVDLPCEYMNCRRPRSEHKRAVDGSTKGRRYPL